MQTISAYMSDEHARCDELFVEAEAAAAVGAWDKCRKAFADFHDSMRRHLLREEEVLFPEFEAVSGLQMGPTYVMRGEHIQMRELMEEMAAAAQEGRQERYLSLSETLLVLMQQHNLKEEQILYPMTDSSFGNSRGRLLEKMAGITDAA